MNDLTHLFDSEVADLVLWDLEGHGRLEDCLIYCTLNDSSILLEDDEVFDIARKWLHQNGTPIVKDLPSATEKNSGSQGQ